MYQHNLHKKVYTGFRKNGIQHTQERLPCRCEGEALRLAGAGRIVKTPYSLGPFNKRRQPDIGECLL